MSMEDYTKGYREGFKDGYEQGKKDADDGLRKLPIDWIPKNPIPEYPKDSCYVCGIKWKDSTHYCCMRMDCPSKIIFTATTIVDPGPDDVGC